MTTDDVAGVVKWHRQMADYLLKQSMDTLSVAEKMRLDAESSRHLQAATLLEAEHAARVKAEAERDEARNLVSLMGDGPVDWGKDPGLIAARAAERDKERLLKALEFYADPGNHKCGDVFTDFGKRARTLIKEMEGNG